MAGFAWSNVGGPPAADELEVTVIGPGFGESILVHVGNGRWLVTDSCIDARSNSDKPAPLDYLDAIGVDPATQVDLVVATHWHQDHVRGLGKLVQRCRGARFSCGSAMLEEEFLTYLAAIGGNITTDFRSKPQEMVEVARVLSERNGHARLAKAGLQLQTWKSADQVVCRAIALSPSDAEYTRFTSRIAAMMPSDREPRRAAPPGDPNEVSVVVQIEWTNDVSVLLGADMVLTGDPLRGWKAVMVEHSGSGLPRSKIVKIPHHGSLNAHYEVMWLTGLQEDAIAVVAPYGRGRRETRPPTVSDLERIRGLAGQTYLTSSARAGARERFEAAVERSLEEGGIAVTDATPILGVVQLRRSTGAWNARLFPPATVVRA